MTNGELLPQEVSSRGDGLRQTMPAVRTELSRVLRWIGRLGTASMGGEEGMWRRCTRGSGRIDEVQGLFGCYQPKYSFMETRFWGSTRWS